jgi:adenylate cyclase
MFTFVSTHLLNHSLGLVSLDAMLAGQRVFFAVWHGLPGSSLLLLALLTHLTLVLYKQVVRRTLRMPWVEGIRILLGFTTLYALLYHAVPNVVFRLVFGKPLLYPDFLHTLSADPWLLANQLTLVTAAWSHGCIGLHLWLRLRAPYRRALPVIMAVAVLVPALALLGVLSGAREADERAGHASPGGSYGSSGASAGGDYGSSATSGDYGSYGASDAYGGGGTTVFDLHWLHVSSLVGVTVFFASLIAIRLGLQAWERRRGQVTVRYPGGRQVSATRGASVLEISRIGRVPHASVCGGRGRCSTCRVRVDAGWEHLPAPDDEEVRLLVRIKAPERVRLACQLRPESDIAVTLLVPANARPRDALPYDRMLFGSEQEIVILFADLRGFTKMSENKLPYDVVHILNQYFAEMGEAIESAGGYLDKFIGDGIMALFGLRDGVQAGALNALAAARAMGRRLDDLNGRLTLDLAQPLRLGIGIHVGHVIVGEMGYKRATSLTAIGDAVNVASRLESATKIANCQLLVSADVAARAGADLSAFPLQELKVPGRAEALRVYVITAAVDLPALAGEAALPGGGVVRGATDRPV